MRFDAGGGDGGGGIRGNGSGRGGGGGRGKGSGGRSEGLNVVVFAVVLSHRLLGVRRDIRNYAIKQAMDNVDN